MIGVVWTARSSNRKTGDVPTAWIGRTVDETRKSCAGCAFLPPGEDGLGGRVGGCYAYRGFTRAALQGVQRVGLTLAAALAARAPTARMVRVSSIGDAGRISGLRDKLERACARRGLVIVGYTHHWRERDVDQEWRGVLLASCEDLADADRAVDAGWRAACVVPPDFPDVGVTPAGRRVIVCPAETRPGVTCNDCLLCSGTRRRPDVIAFRPHGADEGVVSRALLQLPLPFGDT